MKFSAVAFLLLLSAASMAQAPVEITSEPSHHLEFQNEFVRVFKVEIPAHGSTLLHSHTHDYFVVALAPANAISEVQGKPPAPIRMAAGEVRFSSGNFIHIVRNQADAPFPNVDIEILKPTSYKWDEERGVSVLEGGTHEIFFVKDGVRASETDLQPHAMIPKHTHRTPHLVIAITDIDLENTSEGQPPKHVVLKSGEAAWAEAGITHTVMNAGHETAKFISLESPPDAK
jgi:quercetin dioxygenase-like cupin family protein